MFSTQRLKWFLLVVITVLLVTCYFAGIYQARKKVLKIVTPG